MAMLTILIAAAMIVAPAEAGIAPWQSRSMQSAAPRRAPLFARQPIEVPPFQGAALSERHPLAVPALQGTTPWERHPSMARTPARAAPIMSPVVTPESIEGNIPLEHSEASIDSCPGDDNDKCDYDTEHRICAQLLDKEGKPLNWGDHSIEHLMPHTVGHVSSGGASKCINVSQTAALVQKVGCENMQIRCHSTDLSYLTARNWDAYGRWGLSLAPAVECLNMLCNPSADSFLDNSEMVLSNQASSKSPAQDAKTIQQAYKQCEDVTSTFSKTFYIGTGLMKPAARKHAWAIYAWCRRLDDIVDSPQAQLNPQRLNSDLKEWTRRMDGIWKGQRPDDMFDLAMVDTVRAYPTLDKKPFRDMIDGMIMDVPGHPKGKLRYETFDELYLYCYRVAGTVGMMMLPILGTAAGVTEEEAKAPAEALGIALQLTNILRDVGEDLSRGRIYLPLDELKQFGLTEDDLFARKVTEKYKSFLEFQIARARDYYVEAERGIPMLAPNARFAVRASLDLYGRILDKIEANGYDNFNKRAYTTGLEKLGILPGSWMKSLKKDDSSSNPVVNLVSATHDANAWRENSAGIVVVGIAAGAFVAAAVALRRRRLVFSAEPMLG